MAKEKILDAFIRQSPQKYITRYHNTGIEHIPSILEKGILKDNRLRPREDALVFTTANKDSWRVRRPVQVVAEIPKDWYREHSAQNQSFDKAYLGEDYDFTRRHKDKYLKEVYGEELPFRELATLPVYEGGRVSVFNESIPPGFIKKVCVDDGNCIDADKLYGLPDWEMLYMFEKNRGER